MSTLSTPSVEYGVLNKHPNIFLWCSLLDMWESSYFQCLFEQNTYQRQSPLEALFQIALITLTHRSPPQT